MSETDFSNPQSRAEKILAKTIQKYTGSVEDPQSRIEELLLALNDYIIQLAQGSGGGSPDWNVTDETANEFIKNKPRIKQGSYSTAICEGRAKDASGWDAHAEGYNTEATGNGSHAEGGLSKASGSNSHAEGDFTIASGDYSHAENKDSHAYGDKSHAEGDATNAVGIGAHAEGMGTSATGAYSHVGGKYNIKDVNEIYAEIIGNGESDKSRSNARTLDWNGNEVLAGKLTVGAAPAEDMDAATKKYVDDSISDFQTTVKDWIADLQEKNGS